MNKFSISLLSLIILLIVGCSQPTIHNIPVGSADAIIPIPVLLIASPDSLGNSRLEYFPSDNFKVQGVENLGKSWEVVESWLTNAGIDVELDFASKPNLTFVLYDDPQEKDYYFIQFKGNEIVISAHTEEFLFRGWTTLRLMMPVSAEVGGCSNGFFLPSVFIIDSPNLVHRGLLLDCCRHFMEPEFVKKMIDNLALHKMNVLHWHLTEDQGWRIEIDAYPELTNVGAWRTELDGSTHGGFYTKEEIRDIVAYASARHVEIIPEIELPGHSKAALSAYPWLGCTGDTLPVANKWGVFKDIYCAGNDTTLKFLETVLDEVCELFPSSRIHIGGDEAPKVRWRECDKCQTRIHSENLADEHELQTWFIDHIGSYLESKGKTIIGWDEILEGGLPEGAVVQSWRGMDGAIEAVHLGADVIVSPTSHCYLDYPLSSIDLEKVYSFNPRPPEVMGGTGKILGGECNMWTEHAPQELVESKVFPRAIALAEVLWSGSWSGYDDFLSRLDPHLNRLDLLGVDYGLESDPVSISLALDEESNTLNAVITPSGPRISGTASFIPSKGSIVDPSMSSFSETLTVTGPGEIVANVNYRSRDNRFTERFLVDHHSAVFKPLDLSYEPSPYYTGGGHYALVDGRLGSDNFRDGTWQAVQGGDMEMTVDLGEELFIDSISLNFYVYQDAWIFKPSILVLSTSSNGEVFEIIDVLEFGEASNTLEKNDFQGIVNLSTGRFENLKTRWIRVKAVNAGVCPDWHEAATEPTWIFVDELVVRKRI
jgi:hexosaminidase